MTRILVTGAGGFIGGHLVKYLLSQARATLDPVTIVAIDLKPEHLWWQVHRDAVNIGNMDLTNHEETYALIRSINPVEVYALAANMGGMGFIAYHGAQILNTSMRISMNTIDAAHSVGVKKLLYTSSVCVYPYDTSVSVYMNEYDAYPANPSDDYGWEKLTAERMLQAYHRDYGFDIRIARLHNTYGTHGTWNGGREKAPAALCRKAAEAKLGGLSSIEVWGNSETTRVFLHVDDCVEGLVRLMESRYTLPLNLGCEQTVSISSLARLALHCADIPQIAINYVTGPVGHKHRGHSSYNCLNVLGWQPRRYMEQGIYELYKWVEQQVISSRGNQ